jgi:predicted MPP superfamily phosphohydrolase
VANAQNIRIANVEIPFRGLPGEFDGLLIAHVSDLHIADSPAFEEELLQTVNGLNADVILITGDIVICHKDPLLAISVLRRFNAKEGIFCVFGNTDNDRADPARLAESIRRSGVIVLNNASFSLTRKDSFINLVGVDDCTCGRDNLYQAMQGVNESGFRILLSHSPAITRRLGGVKFDLILSGHTHAGQTKLSGLDFMFGLLKARTTYLHGLYKLSNGSVLYVTRGIYYRRRIPRRWQKEPEVSVLRLKRAV